MNLLKRSHYHYFQRILAHPSAYSSLLKIKSCCWAVFTLIALFLSANSFAQQEGIIILSDTVTGNQEQPKVLYIVPWQAAHDNTMLKQALVTKLQNDVFAHIERPEHKRQLQFIKQLSATEADDIE